MLPFQEKVSCKYGSPMGRYDDNASDLVGLKVHLRRVPMVDGDYDQGGAYWGGYPSPPLFCAWTEDKVHYFRAPSRAAAKALLPGCKFYR